MIQDPENPNQKILDSSLIIEDGDDSVIGKGATCKVKRVRALVLDDEGREKDQILALKVYKRRELERIRFSAPIPYGPVKVYTEREREEDS